MKTKTLPMPMRIFAVFFSIIIAFSSCRKSNFKEEASPASDQSSAQANVASAAATSSLFICSPGATMYRFNAATGSIIWQKQLAGASESTPCYANGVVYINTDDTTYALQANNGSLVWKKRTGHVTGALLINKQKVYFTTDSSFVYCMNAVAGTTIWKQQFGHVVESFNKQSSPAIQDDVLYVGGTDATLYAVIAATGVVKWQRPEANRSGIHSSPCVYGNKVYVTYDYGTVYAYDAASGAKVWLQPSSTSVDKSPSVSDNRLYQSSRELSCLNPVTGAIYWKFQDTVKPRSTVGSDAFADNKNVYVSCGVDRYALDKATGAIVWLNTAFGNDSYSASPVAADGLVYFVGFGSRSLEAINTETGASVWYGGLSGSSDSYFAKGSPIIIKGNGEAVYPVISGMRQ